MYHVTIVEYPSNKSTTYPFSKLKDAYQFLKASKKLYPRAYLCLWFDNEV